MSHRFAVPQWYSTEGVRDIFTSDVKGEIDGESPLELSFRRDGLVLTNQCLDSELGFFTLMLRGRLEAR